MSLTQKKFFQHIFAASGGTQKGIAFEKLLCGLVLLTRGNNDEKIKCKISLHICSEETFLLFFITSHLEPSNDIISNFQFCLICTPMSQERMF